MIDWFEQHGATFWDCERLEFPLEKPVAILYVDDRGYSFTGSNWPTIEFLECFKPWNKK